MQRSLFIPATVESTVAEGDLFRNDILGPAAFFIAITALQFDAPGQSACIGTVAFVFVVFWGYGKAPLYKEAHDRFYRQYGAVRGWFVAFIRNPVLFLGLAFLVLVAMGHITADTLSWFSLSRVFGPDSASGV